MKNEAYEERLRNFGMVQLEKTKLKGDIIILKITKKGRYKEKRVQPYQ